MTPVNKYLAISAEEGKRSSNNLAQAIQAYALQMQLSSLRKIQRDPDFQKKPACPKEFQLLNQDQVQAEIIVITEKLQKLNAELKGSSPSNLARRRFEHQNK